MLPHIPAIASHSKGQLEAVLGCDFSTMFCLVIAVFIFQKQVDQGMVLLGVHHMKRECTKGLLTKDVRSAEGWQVGVDVFEHVQV